MAQQNDQIVEIEMPSGEVLEFPADMPQEQMRESARQYFAQTSGMAQQPQAQPPTGFAGIGQDILQAAKAAPEQALEAIGGLAQLPGEALAFGKQAATEPTRALKNLAIGMGKTGEAIGRAPYNLEQYFRSKGLLDPEGQFIKPVEKIDWEDLFQMGGQQPGDVLAQETMGFAPFGAAGMLGKGSRLGRIGQQSLSAGAYEGVKERNPLTGALIPPLVEAPFAAAGRVGTPFKGRLTREGLEENIRVAQGKDVPLGEIIQSPRLKKLQENVLDPSFLSGSGERQTRLAQQVGQEAGGLLGGRIGRPPTGLEPQQFKQTLIDAFDEQTRRKNDLYEPVNRLASEENFVPDLKESRKFSKDVAKQIHDSSIIKNDPDFKKLLNKVLDISESKKTDTKTLTSPIFDEFGSPFSEQITKTRSPSILEVKMVADKLSREGERHKKSPTAADRSIGGVYEKISSKLRKDLKEDVGKKGSLDLQEALSVADENYAENFSKFLDKEAYKFLDPEMNSDAIAREIINPGKEDKFTRIEKIQNLLPEGSEHALGEIYLKGAYDKNGNLNLKELSSRINKLNKKQFEALFPGFETRQQLNDFVKLRGMSEESLSAMFNPKTGARLSVPFMQQAQFYGTGAGHLGAAAIPPLISRALSNPRIKNAYLNALLREKGGAPSYLGPASDVGKLAAILGGEQE